MKALALGLLLAVPALAAEPAGRTSRHKKAPRPQPREWETLLQSSRAALEASRSGHAPAEVAPAPQPELARPPAPAAAPMAPADDTPDLVDRPRRVAPPLPASPPPASAPAAVVAEPPAQPMAVGSAGSVAGSYTSSPAAALPPPSPTPPAGGDLDFDLLARPEAPPEALMDPLLEAHMARRRTMLTVHQSVGIGLVGLMAGTMITGQLNYLDRFGGGADTARYERAHQYLATATLATFGAAGLLAFFAPVPIARESDGIDRATLHKIGMIGATLGMVAEGILGVLTAHHEGLADQTSLARVHLAIGYSTLTCMTVGVGALVF